MKSHLAEFNAPLNRIAVNLQNVTDNFDGKPSRLQHLICAYFQDSLQKKCSSRLVIGFEEATLFQAP